MNSNCPIQSRFTLNGECHGPGPSAAAVARTLFGVAAALAIGSAAAAPVAVDAAAEMPALSLAALTESGAAPAPIESAGHAVPLGAGNASLFELTLWNFIGGIRAQQRSDYFQVAQTLTTTLRNTIQSGGQVPAVPLPPAAWLFPAGLVAIFGLRRLSAARRIG